MVAGKQADARASVGDVPRTPAQRVVIGGVSPCIDGGGTAIKRVAGESVQVAVDLVADGHDVLAGRVCFRPVGEAGWRVTPLAFHSNDRYTAAFVVDRIGPWEYRVEGWVDPVASFLRVLERKLSGNEQADIVSHLLQGAVLVRALAERVGPDERDLVNAAAQRLDAAQDDVEAARAAAGDPLLARRSSELPDPEHVSHTAGAFPIDVERPRAAFSAWYEFFPRSCAPEAGTHGRFRDCGEQLQYVADMGFDVVYLPPIHPIGRSHRKGRNNQTECQPGDPGSPWAIGGPEGGHKAVHPELGTLEDFRWFVREARARGLEVALDIAFQVSPDHPYVAEHADWFVRRPDGTIQYAENPPKKYQDIYPFHFECRDAEGLWKELLSVFEFWIEQGVTIFRVDNPHTKSLAFWRYCVGQLKRRHPEVILLSEAFTRPKLMYALTKLGFSQSYTYFTWRNSAHELREYLTELTQTDVVEFFRPNFWPNTPDILPEHLQFGGRPAFVARLVLAATLSSNYGIYGPAYELLDAAARPGSGEYLDNEKYEIKRWNLDDPDSLGPLITRVNRIRKEHEALQGMRSLRFHVTDNDALLCYSKRSGDQVVLVVVNLDPHHTQSGWVGLDEAAVGVESMDTFQMHDLLGGGRFLWSGPRNYVSLNPAESPAHIFLIRKRTRTEYDFDYFA